MQLAFGVYESGRLKWYVCVWVCNRWMVVSIHSVLSSQVPNKFWRATTVPWQRCYGGYGVSVIATLPYDTQPKSIVWLSDERKGWGKRGEYLRLGFINVECVLVRWLFASIFPTQKLCFSSSLSLVLWFDLSAMDAPLHYSTNTTCVERTKYDFRKSILISDLAQTHLARRANKGWGVGDTLPITPCTNQNGVFSFSFSVEQLLVDIDLECRRVWNTHTQTSIRNRNCESMKPTICGDFSTCFIASFQVSLSLLLRPIWSLFLCCARHVEHIKRSILIETECWKIFNWIFKCFFCHLLVLDPCLYPPQHKWRHSEGKGVRCSVFADEQNSEYIWRKLNVSRNCHWIRIGTMTEHEKQKRKGMPRQAMNNGIMHVCGCAQRR